MKKALIAFLLLAKFAHADDTTLPPPIDPYLAAGYISAELTNLGALHYKVPPIKRRALSLGAALIAGTFVAFEEAHRRQSPVVSQDITAATLGGGISLIFHW